MCINNLHPHPALQELGLAASHRQAPDFHTLAAGRLSHPCLCGGGSSSLLQDCTALYVTKFPSARVLKASFMDAIQWELMKVPPANIPTTKVPWLEQLAAWPQLARAEFNCFELSPAACGL